MAIGETYRCSVKGSYLGEEFVNRYYYQQINGSSGAAAMAQAIEAQLLPSLALCQHESVLYQEIEVVSLGNPVGFVNWVIDPVVIGDLSGPPSPSFNAWGFTLLRASREMRSGGKRLVGVPEDATDGNDPTGAALAILNGVAGAFAADLTFGADNIYQPRLVREAPGDVILVNIGIDGAVFARYTTQNSRKP